MIEEGRLKASIDQLDNFVDFENGKLPWIELTALKLCVYQILLLYTHGILKYRNFACL
jgi:hypothetical protein